MVAIQELANDVTFGVKVHPRAKKNAITGEIGDSLKLSITAPPVDGKANEELVALVAEYFKCRKAAVAIKAGASGRTKLVKVETQ